MSASIPGVSHPLSGASYSAVELRDDDMAVVLLDQRRLPHAEVYEVFTTPDSIADAIADMVVRGAPAIGIAAAYAVSLAARPSDVKTSSDYLTAIESGARRLTAARPTAVNLAWAVMQMLDVARASLAATSGDQQATHQSVAAAARALHRADVDACRAMGLLGAARLPQGARVLTHCNAGALATGGYGTALGVIRAAHEAGKLRGVLADETRPYLQGARLTAWELARDGVPVEIITDAMPAYFLARGEVDAVIVGADRIARNGDVANKIGSYGLALLAAAHGVPFYVAAPWSTIDPACPSGASIPIEQRASDEVLVIGMAAIGPTGVRARHPAFDITPARHITAIFTERGVISPVSQEGIAALAG